MLGEQFFDNKKFHPYLTENYISYHASLNEDTGRKLHKDYYVFSTPTVLIANADGTEKNRISGYGPPPEDFKERLEKARYEEITILPPDEYMQTIYELPWTGAGEDALIAYQTVKRLRPQNMAINLVLKLGLILFDGAYYEESFEVFESLPEINPSNTNLIVALIWMGHLEDLNGNREIALQYYKEALTYDFKGTIMRHDQYGIKINRNWIEERIKTPFRRTGS